MARAVSFNPETFVGLADDFDGEIVEVRYVPWDYNGTQQTHTLAARVTMRPDEESGFSEFAEHISVGDLQFFAPSKDGVEAVDLDAEDLQDMEGSFLVQVGRRASLSRSSNWAQFMIALLAAGYPSSAVDQDVSSLEGLRAHFNRIPQQKRSGLRSADGEGRPKTLLVVTEVLEVPGGKAKSRKAGKSESQSAKRTPTSNLAANGAPPSDDLDDRIIEVVLAALAADEELSKSQLPQFVMKAFTNGKEKAAAVKRVTNSAFLASVDAWSFNPDEGTLSL